ncbi:MAG: hypothetical protein JRD93_10075 [Deltaproteobacteria bacterium]|nr:hypothetical protein [Deltaproteobacteria bacterium]
MRNLKYTNNPERIIIIGKYNFHIVVEVKTSQNEYFPSTYKSGLISNNFISLGLSDMPATSLYSPLNFLSWVKKYESKNQKINTGSIAVAMKYGLFLDAKIANKADVIVTAHPLI